MNTLSVIIITKNEADNIDACLQSVKFADEIIVVDSGSTDDTLLIANKYTDKVFVMDWPGYGVQKNRALQLATCDWVFSIDADEIVPLKLAEEIQNVIQDPNECIAFYVMRKSKYCQQMIYFGDWKNDKCVRLFKRGAAKFNDLTIHEALVTEGKLGQLKNAMIHNTYETLEEALQKMNDYSSLSAKEKFSQGKRSSLLQAMVRGAWTFFRGYFLKLGFLDGKNGLLLAISNAEGCFYRYIKLMMLNDQKTKL